MKSHTLKLTKQLLISKVCTIQKYAIILLLYTLPCQGMITDIVLASNL